MPARVHPMMAGAFRVLLFSVFLVAPIAQAAPAAASTTIVWTNRGQAADGFDTVFGAGEDANRARAVVDAGIDHWERVLTSLNRPLTPGDDTLDIEITAEPGDSPTSCGGGADGNYDALGWPTDGGTVSVTGNEPVWFVDPTPNDHSEFTGSIDNAFSGEPQAGSPATGLCDMYTVVVAEMMHILGVSSDAASRFHTGLFNTQLTVTGTTCAGPGNLYAFQGASITALMTSNNGGSGGTDKGVPTHTAEPCSSATTPSGVQLVGSEDAGNALFDAGRYIPSNLDMLILRDVYNYVMVMPETFGTFYATLNQTSGNLLVRGEDDGASSDDNITINRAGDNLAVSVDIGDDVPGTGPTDAFVSSFPTGDVRSITIDAGDGKDTIILGAGLAVPVSVSGGDGDDTIFAAEGDDVLDGGAGNDRIFAGQGNNVVTDGTGNDLVDLTENSAPASIVTQGGDDTVLGSSFNDTLTSLGGEDRLEGRGGNDLLNGGPGADALFGHDGSDTFIWDEGDGDDTIEGGAGESDAIQVNALTQDVVVDTDGSSRVRVTVGSGSPSLGSIEDVRVNGGLADDLFAVEDLFGTEVRKVLLNPGLGNDLMRIEGRETSELIEASPVGSTEIAVGGFVYDLRVVEGSGDDTLEIRGNGGNDILMASGTPGVNAIGVSPTAMDAATLLVGGLDIDGVTVEQIAVEGRGGNDSLTVTTPAGPNQVTHAPGLTRDSGAVAIPGLIPIRYASLGLPGSVMIADAGGTRVDDLTVEGTAGADTIGVGGGAGVVSVNSQSPVTPSGALNLTASGGVGDDRMTLSAVLPFATTTANGGDSIQGDALRLEGAAGAATVDTATSTVLGYGGVVAVVGTEKVTTAQTGGAATALTLLGTAAPDAVDYRPTGAQAGALNVSGFLPALTFEGVGGTLLLDPLGDSDRVSVLGTLADDLITSKVLPLTTVQVNATKTATIPQATSEKISAYSDEGADTFDVTTFDSVAARLFVFGDQPSSKRFAELMNVRNGSASHVQYRDVKGHLFENGSVFAEYRSTANTTRIDYEGLEKLKFYR